MKQFNSQLRYVEARPRKEKKGARATASIVVAGSASEGGVSKSYVDSNFVNLATEQEISGKKNFTGGLLVNGQPIVWDAEKGVWQLDGDLVLTGALTMFGSLSGFKPSTIMDAVLVDNETIIKVKDAQGNWELRATGRGSGGTGGGLTAAEVNALIEAALVPYALTTAIPTNNNQLTNGAGYITTSALLGYATEQWVSNQGFAKQSSLNGVDNRLKSVETFFATSDTNNLVDKWSEIVTFLNATEGDTLDNILKTKANQSALDAAVASLTTEIGKKWTQNDAKIANWDSAYSWGNHANAGYAAKTYVDGELAKYVKLATAQTISARHNFSDGLQIGGITIRKSQDSVVYIDGNLLTTGNIEGGIFGLRNSKPDNPSLRLTVGNQNYYVQATSEGIYLGPTSILSLKVDIDGNVVIGGPTADYKLHIHGVGGFNDGLWAQGIRLERTDEINSYGSMGGAGNGNLHLNYRSSGLVSIAYGGGNVSVGKASGGIYAHAKLHVHGDAIFADAISTPRINIGGLAISKSQGDTLFIDANVVVRGALTMFGVNTAQAMMAMEERVSTLEAKLNQLT